MISIEGLSYRDLTTLLLDVEELPQHNAVSGSQWGNIVNMYQELIIQTNQVTGAYKNDFSDQFIFRKILFWLPVSDQSVGKYQRPEDSFSWYLDNIYFPWRYIMQRMHTYIEYCI